MNLKKIAIEKMNPAPYNPRVDLQPESDEYRSIQNSIEEFGYLSPIVWNERTGNIVSGHQRYKILKARGETEVDCIVVSFDETTEKACNLAMNKAVGSWDDEKLDALLQEMRDSRYDMADFGFKDVPFAWDGVDDLDEDNYDEPQKPTIECPHCHHIDTPAHFKKYKGDA